MRTLSLIVAVQSNHMSWLVQLVNGGSDVNVVNAIGRSAAHYAVLMNNQEALEFLISNGADLNLTDKAGNTPLDLWHMHKNKKALEILHAAGAKPSDLWQAAANNDRAAAERLLAAGADAKVKNDVGKVPFEVAAEKGKTETMALLIKHGANTEAQDTNGFTALQLATKTGKTEIVRLLREHSEKRISVQQE